MVCVQSVNRGRQNAFNSLKRLGAAFLSVWIAACGGRVTGPTDSSPGPRATGVRGNQSGGGAFDSAGVDPNRVDDAGLQLCSFGPDCADSPRTQCTAGKEKGCATLCNTTGRRPGCLPECFGYCRPAPLPSEQGSCYVDEDCHDLPGTTCNAPLECSLPPNCNPANSTCSTLCYGHCQPVLPVDEPGGCYTNRDCANLAGTQCTASWECQRPPMCRTQDASCPLVCYGHCQ
jgi:hypothetical protein